MTIEQFHIEFKVFFDKVDSAAYPEFLDGEIDIYLNEAQDRIIKQRYGKNNMYRSGFEEIQKRTDDLKNLVKTRFCPVTQDTSYAFVGDNVYRADLSSLFEDGSLTVASTDQYRFYLKSIAQTCEADGNCCTWSRVKLVQQDDVSSIASDPFNKPMKDRPIVFFEDGDIFVWTANPFIVGGFQVTFLKVPAQMNIGTYGQPRVDSELSEHLHKEILQEAIEIALENISSPRVKTQGPINVTKAE